MSNPTPAPALFIFESWSICKRLISSCKFRENNFNRKVFSIFKSELPPIPIANEETKRKGAVSRHGVFQVQSVRYPNNKPKSAAQCGDRLSGRARAKQSQTAKFAYPLFGAGFLAATTGPVFSTRGGRLRVNENSPNL